MDNTPDERARQIAELEAALRRLKASLHAPDAHPSAESAVQGAVTIGGVAQVAGPVVGVNLGTIIYGPDHSIAQREQLTGYLRRLAAKLARLPLRGLAATLDDGPGIALPKVYVMLATTSQALVAQDGAPRQAALLPVAQFYQGANRTKPFKAEYDPTLALPDRAIVDFQPILDEYGGLTNGRKLYRALLATEAVQRHQRIVLLGDPGGGKSTFLRHLAWALAQRGLDQSSDATALVGWEDATRLLPILLPLRALAARIATAGADPATVSAALRDELAREYDIREADELLDQALQRGAALLLFDGLDEIPLEAVSGVSADRLTALRAVRDFAELHASARVVLTCRVRAFDAALRACAGWPVETLALFSLGQIRYFAAEWYAALIARGSIAHDLGASQEQALISAIVENERLHTMAATPLLLTMMALILYEKGALPRDRALLYERILEQLLGQWDQQKGGRSLAALIGAPSLRSEDLRGVLDQLAYQAHSSTTATDARGRLSSDDLLVALAKFFERIRVPGAWEAAGRCLAYFNERSGLLVPEDDGAVYTFAHLTLQEHCAGRHLLLASDAVAQVMQHRTDDRWREPIGLGLGVVQKLHAPLADRIDRILTELIDRDEGGRPKPAARWQRDLILAAELGAERDWDLLRAVINVDRIQRDLRRGLAALLDDAIQPLPVAERVRAGFLLCALGDPRFPVTIEQWSAALAQRSERFGAPAGYWCYVRPGTYRIGGWEEGEPAANIALPGFWVARLPITVAQYAPFMDAGYGSEATRWWTPNGWRWKLEQAHTMPMGWANPRYHSASQPMISVTWYEATAFCAWLSKQLADALPASYAVRLPTEAEWEAAAAYTMDMQRRSYPWGEADPTPERAIYGESGLRAPAPVGCCPSGAAACGVLDLVGNAWELTSSSYHSYPAHSGKIEKDFTSDDVNVSWRGGGWVNDSISIRCGARVWDHPDFGDIGYGFRAVVAPAI